MLATYPQTPSPHAAEVMSVPACTAAPGFRPLAETLASVRVAAYNATRNHLQGAVTRLSPYLTHGAISLPAVADALPELRQEHQLFRELAWREFFAHVWQHRGDAIYASLRDSGLPPPMFSVVPPDVRMGMTGLAVIDQAVRALYSTGYLHNHARMWLAAYLVHYRKVDWRAGAAWMYGHLLDGDPASNALSWQWVAASFSRKPYLFNAENVAKFAPADWQVEGSAIDCDYETLEQLARSPRALPPLALPPAQRPCLEPALHTQPSDLSASELNLPVLPSARAVQILHPWHLGAAPSVGAWRLAVVHLPYHQRYPWSARRWQWVMHNLRARADAVFVGDVARLIPQLRAASSVQAQRTLHSGYHDFLRQLGAGLTDAPRLLQAPDRCYPSFSQFYAALVPQAREGLRHMHRAA